VLNLGGSVVLNYCLRIVLKKEKCLKKTHLGKRKAGLSLNVQMRGIPNEKPEY
jgi:hypothetical protein